MEVKALFIRRFKRSNKDGKNIPANTPLAHASDQLPNFYVGFYRRGQRSVLLGNAVSGIVRRQPN